MKMMRTRNMLRTTSAAFAVAMVLGGPVTAQMTDRPVAELLELKTNDAPGLSVVERITLLNVVAGEDRFSCRNAEAANCEKRITMATARLMGRDVKRGQGSEEQRKAYFLLKAWADANPGLIEAAEKEIDERRSAAADADAEAETVQTETVTEETSRSSDEERAEVKEDNSDRDMLLALGALGAAAALGSYLANGDEVVAQQDDRVVVRRDGELLVRQDENEILRRPGAEVTTATFADGSTRTVVDRDDGSQVVTIRDAEGYTVRRTRLLPDGRSVVLFDDTMDGSRDLTPAPAARTDAEPIRYAGLTEAELERRLRLEDRSVKARYSLRRVREDVRVRESVPAIDLAINFATGSAALRPNEARDLRALGRTVSAMIDRNPDEVFLIEGHTDAVGSETYNLALSDRRAEAVALALIEYFDVPPENLVVQGYGENFLRIETQQAEQRNRRATVRRITPLLRHGEG